MMYAVTLPGCHRSRNAIMLMMSPMITTRFDAKSEMANAPILQRHLYYNHQHACEPLRLDSMERTTEHLNVNVF
jgi:hypothetical protein